MLFSAGSKVASLGEADIRRVVTGALDQIRLDGKRVLVIIPDHSRSGPTGLFFRAIADPRDRALFAVIYFYGLRVGEVALLARAGFVPVSLGPRTLRAETAAVAALAILQHRWGDLR